MGWGIKYKVCFMRFTGKIMNTIGMDVSEARKRYTAEIFIENFMLKQC